MYRFKRTVGFCAIVVSAIFIVVIIALSWKPSPSLITLPLLPIALLKWADLEVNANLRTAVPFVGLGMATCLILLLRKAKAKHYTIACLACLLFLTIVELFQIYIPLRHADMGDVGWGILGFLFGISLTWLVYQLLFFLWRRKNKQQE